MIYLDLFLLGMVLGLLLGVAAVALGYFARAFMTRMRKR